MSNALGRLRRIFKDELLVRTASGMQPTPRAEELRQTIQPLLRQIERTFETGASFDPARSSRTFAIRLSDLLGFLLLPPLLARLKKDAPGIALDVLHLPPAKTVDALERDEIDVAVSMSLEHSSAICSEVMLRDRMVCVMSTSHALADQELSFDNFLAQRHLKISMSPADLRFVDNVLAHQKLTRNVQEGVSVPRGVSRAGMVNTIARGSELSTSLIFRRGNAVRHARRFSQFLGNAYRWASTGRRRRIGQT
jgi:DNA-binding transcriptional LysR family regulator